MGEPPLSGNCCRMSCCLSSSRLKTMSFLGRCSFNASSMNLRPNEPVAPVMRIDWPSSVMGGNIIERESSALSDRKSTRLNSSHVAISYAVFCLKKKKHLLACCHDDM